MDQNDIETLVLASFVTVTTEDCAEWIHYTGVSESWQTLYKEGADTPIVRVHTKTLPNSPELAF